MIIGAKVKERDHLGTDQAVTDTIVWFNQEPLVGDEIKLNIRNEKTDFKARIEKYSVIKRVIFDLDQRDSNHLYPFHLKLILSNADDSCTYQRLYLDCKLNINHSEMVSLGQAQMVNLF
jgi:hypothetical protein